MAASQSKKKKRYLMQKTLGKGAFGTVYLTKEEGTDNLFAIKETFQDARYKNREASVLKEVSKHQSVIKVFQMFFTEKNNGKYLNIVMEYLPANLHDVIHNHSLQSKKMSEKDIKYYMFQLCRACSFLSRLGICHRDIKPQNIVVDPVKKEIRLCDFGSAKKLSDGEWNKHYICSRFYRAPELLCESNYYTCDVDSWSLGCVMAEMYIQRPIFNGHNTREQLKLVSRILGPLPSKYPKKSDSQIIKLPAVHWKKVLQTACDDSCDFIRSLLCYIPQQRWNLLECLFHPFLKEFTDPNNKNISDYPKINWLKEETDIIQQSGWQNL